MATAHFVRLLGIWFRLRSRALAAARLLLVISTVMDGPI